jgi:hypothetical protein
VVSQKCRIWMDKRRNIKHVYNNRYGKPIPVESLLPLYLEDPKRAAKLLTKTIEEAMEKLTVNAPNWDSKYAADMARWLLFPGENGLMKDYIPITQRLVWKTLSILPYIYIILLMHKKQLN